jgi:hypothetical protein
MADGENDISIGPKISGFPVIPYNQIPPCDYAQPDGSFKSCSVEGSYICTHKRKFSNRITELLLGLVAKPAIFPPSYTPAYSNDAFALLALALEKITGSNFETMFNESIIEAHGLLRTTYTVPSTTEDAVIPGNTTSSGWDANLGIWGA